MAQRSSRHHPSPRQVLSRTLSRSRRVLIPETGAGAFKLEKVVKAAHHLGVQELMIASRYASDPETLHRLAAPLLPAGSSMQLHAVAGHLDTHLGEYGLFDAVRARGGVNAICCGYEPCLGAAAQLSYSLAAEGLLPQARIYHTPGALGLLRDKWASRLHFNQLGGELLSVWVDRVSADDLTIATLREKGAPDELVFLPQSGSGSQGVTYVDLRRADAQVRLLAARQRIAKLVDHPTSHRTDFSTLVAVEFVRGEEFSIEVYRAWDPPMRVYRNHVVGIHWKTDIDGGRVEGNHHFLEGSKMTLPPGSRVHRQLSAAVNPILDSVMGLRDGVIHLEVRRQAGSEKIYPIEANLRPAGGILPESMGHATGEDLFTADLSGRLGIPYPISHRWHRPFGAMNLFPPTGGRFEGFRLQLADQSIDGNRLTPAQIEDAVNNYIWGLDRHTVFDQFVYPYLRDVDYPAPLREQLAFAFDRRGTGMRTRVFRFLPWIAPGTDIDEIDLAYLAGLLVAPIGMTRDIDDHADMAEIVATQAIIKRVVRGMIS